MAGNSGLLKRIAQLEKAIRIDRARLIVMEVDGMQEDEQATAALLQELDVKSVDLVVAIKRYGSKREGLPRLCSSSPL
jgi:hypothetical protein